MKYFYKVFTILLICFTMCSCKKEVKQVSEEYVLPESLSYCKLADGQASQVLEVLYCPNKTTYVTPQEEL